MDSPQFSTGRFPTGHFKTSINDSELCNIPRNLLRARVTFWKKPLTDRLGKERRATFHGANLANQRTFYENFGNSIAMRVITRGYNPLGIPNHVHLYGDDRT